VGYVPGVASALVIFVASLAFWSSPAPDSPSPFADQNSDAALFGKVVDAVNGRAIPDARVVLTRVRRVRPVPGEPLEGIRARSTSVLTADDGTFNLRDLESGEYVLVARKSGYSGGYYGQQSPADDLQHFDLRIAETARGVTLRLWSGAVVSGRIAPSAEKPTPPEWVQVLRIGAEFGIARLSSAGRAKVGSDTGEFRVSGLAPGQYLIRTMAKEPSPLPGVAAFPISPAPSSFYYPNTSQLSLAEVITLEAGEERGGVEFQIPDSLPRAQSIAGRIDGLPYSLSETAVRLVLADHPPHLPANLEIATAAVRPDGTFVFPHVPNGTYHLRGISGVGAISPVDRQNVTGSLLVPSAPRTNAIDGNSGTSWFGTTLAIQDRSVAGLNLVVQPGARITGRFVLDPESQLPAPTFADLGVTALSLSGWNLDGFPSARATADASFDTPPLPPGRYLILSNNTGGWYPERASVTGRDVTIDGIDLREANLTGLVLTLTRRRAEISGVVVDAAGRASHNSHLFVFRTDRPHIDVDSAADAMNLRPNRFGEYKLGLAAGEYFVAAVAGPVPERWKDPAVLRSLIPIARRAQLARGDKVTFNLTARPWRQ